MQRPGEVLTKRGYSLGGGLFDPVEDISRLAETLLGTLPISRRGLEHPVVDQQPTVIIKKCPRGLPPPQIPPCSLIVLGGPFSIENPQINQRPSHGSPEIFI